MKFKFKIQQYQTEAVEQTVNVFAGQPSKTNAQYRRDLGKTAGRQTNTHQITQHHEQRLILSRRVGIRLYRSQYQHVI